MTEGRRRRALLVATGTYGDPGLAQLRAPTGDVGADDRLDLLVTREDASSLDDAVVVYLRKEGRFAPGVALKGLAGLADVDDSPLRVGR